MELRSNNSELSKEQDTIHTKLLIVEDDAEIREQMKWALASEYMVLEAENRPAAVALLQRERPFLVTLDLGLPPHVDDASEGIATLEEFLAVDPMTKVIVITGNSDRVYALKAVALGAYDYIQKPIQLDVLKVVLQRAAYLSHVERENQASREREAEKAFGEILGTSVPIQRVFETIRRVSDSDIPVLIVGQSGTGKELVARAIHRQSARKNGPFVVINCGAIPENLLESELFGHEKGAFTGAHLQRKGRIETAQGGTLFLDEIGELPLALQVKLLRFLQEHQIERVGGREAINVDARVIAATNANLQKAMAEGRFREDLYYRLCGVTVAVPPLRERGGDIELLARSFIQRFAHENSKKITGLTPQALRALQTYGWPGNVRELENRIKRAVIMAKAPKLTPADLELDLRHTKYEGQGLKEARELIEKDLVKGALTRSKGNISKAAADLGISRPTLYELMERLGIGKE